MKHRKSILTFVALFATLVGAFSYNNRRKGHTRGLFTTVNQVEKCSNIVCATACTGGNHSPCPNNGGAIIYYTDGGTCQHPWAGLTTLAL